MKIESEAEEILKKMPAMVKKALSKKLKKTLDDIKNK